MNEVNISCFNHKHFFIHFELFPPNEDYYSRATEVEVQKEQCWQDRAAGIAAGSHKVEAK